MRETYDTEKNQLTNLIANLREKLNEVEKINLEEI
jgi:hypothetical protein